MFVRAIDGDTLVVTVDDSLRKLRRLGIDAPEYDQDGGMAAVVRDWRTGLLTLNRANCRAGSSLVLIQLLLKHQPAG